NCVVRPKRTSILAVPSPPLGADEPPDPDSLEQPTMQATAAATASRSSFREETFMTIPSGSSETAPDGSSTSLQESGHVTAGDCPCGKLAPFTLSDSGVLRRGEPRIRFSEWTLRSSKSTACIGSAGEAGVLSHSA